MASRAAVMAQQVVSWTRPRAGRPDYEAAGRNRPYASRASYAHGIRPTRRHALPWTGLGRGHSTRDPRGAI